MEAFFFLPIIEKKCNTPINLTHLPVRDKCNETKYLQVGFQNCNKQIEAYRIPFGTAKHARYSFSFSY